MKWLIVTGDDFGLHRGVTRGIIQAHRDGILTSASLMVNRPACRDAVALARECPALSLGLHLELDPDDSFLRYGLAMEQIHYNIDLVKPGITLAEFSEKAWRIPNAYAANRYLDFASARVCS